MRVLALLALLLAVTGRNKLPEPCPTPTPSPTAPPAFPAPRCHRGWNPSLEHKVEVFPDYVTVTYTGHWTEPGYGWLSDNSMPINQTALANGQSVTWFYLRDMVPVWQFGHLMLRRANGEQCSTWTGWYQVPPL